MERLNQILMQDKFANIDQIAEMLKEEVTPLARNFFLMDKDVAVRYKKDGNNYIFNVRISACRIKPFGNKFI